MSKNRIREKKLTKIDKRKKKSQTEYHFKENMDPIHNFGLNRTRNTISIPLTPSQTRFCATIHIPTKW